MDDRWNGRTAHPEGRGEGPPPPGGGFPWGGVRWVAAFVLIHLAVLFTLVGVSPTPEDLVEAGGLVGAWAASEPWRLISSLFVHVNLSHVFWNGFSMLIFAVPVVDRLGRFRGTLLYLGAGVAGGVATLLVTDPSVVVVGSSGAVAGLFGAWLVLTVRRLRRRVLRRRALVRLVGIAFLVLPSLLSPAGPGGERVSVAAHVGGLAGGAAVAAAMARGLPPEEPDEEEDEEGEEERYFQ